MFAFVFAAIGLLILVAFGLRKRAQLALKSSSNQNDPKKYTDVVVDIVEEENRDEVLFQKGAIGGAKTQTV